MTRPAYPTDLTDLEWVIIGGVTHRFWREVGYPV